MTTNSHDNDGPAAPSPFTEAVAEPAPDVVEAVAEPARDVVEVVADPVDEHEVDASPEGAEADDEAPPEPASDGDEAEVESAEPATPATSVAPMRGVVGIIANAMTGRDIRRRGSHHVVLSEEARVEHLRRLILGAREGGAERVLLAYDLHGLARRAMVALGSPMWAELVDLAVEGSGVDTTLAVQGLEQLGARVLVVSGGDGTHRQVALAKPGVPVVAVGTGLSNAFAAPLEPLIAGRAAGHASVLGFEEVACFGHGALSLVVDIEEQIPDLALVSVAIVRADPGPSLVSFDGVESVIACVAEPWAIGPSALAGLIAPTGRHDDRAVMVQLDHQAGSKVSVPVAPSLFAEAAVRSVMVLEPSQAVALRGPAVLVLDGEPVRSVLTGERASIRATRSGPFVLDVYELYTDGVRKGAFLQLPVTGD